jgi:hypothetical protein
MKTVIYELIKKFKEAKKLIISKGDYDNGYDGALSDCISVAKLFLEREKEQIMDAQKSGINFNNEDGSQYYRKTFGDNPEAGI